MNNLIFDRTQADVDYAKNRQDDTRDLKGSYNASDLNRVGEWVEYLSNLFKQYGYYATVTVKKDWTMNDYPTKAQMDVYIGNVIKLRDKFCAMTNTPPLPQSMANLSLSSANSIEKNINDMNILLGYMVRVFRPSGTFFAGS